eukprot:1615448-Pleurochrysis_carterae.AAC.1
MRSHCEDAPEDDRGYFADDRGYFAEGDQPNVSKRLNRASRKELGNSWDGGLEENREMSEISILEISSSDSFK